MTDDYLGVLIEAGGRSVGVDLSNPSAAASEIRANIREVEAETGVTDSHGGEVSMYVALSLRSRVFIDYMDLLRRHP